MATIRENLNHFTKHRLTVLYFYLWSIQPQTRRPRLS